MALNTIALTHYLNGIVKFFAYIQFKILNVNVPRDEEESEDLQGHDLIITDSSISLVKQLLY